jgi:hypothetical protein
MPREIFCGVSGADGVVTDRRTQTGTIPTGEPVLW